VPLDAYLQLTTPMWTCQKVDSMIVACEDVQDPVVRLSQGSVCSRCDLVSIYAFIV